MATRIVRMRVRDEGSENIKVNHAAKMITPACGSGKAAF
jgi:hypothetical protein